MLGFYRVGLCALFLILLTGASAAAVPADFQSCLREDLGTKKRLDCYDGILSPQPRASFKTAKAITECRHAREEDARLSCFDSFMITRIPDGVSSGSSQRVAAGRPSSVRNTINITRRAATPPVRATKRYSGPCPCGSGRICVGPRGGRYCMTSGGNKRYGR